MEDENMTFVFRLERVKDLLEGAYHSEDRALQLASFSTASILIQWLEKSDERIVSVMMPCRISVYEKADGKIYVATVNVKSFTEGQSENIQKVMLAAADELEEIVRSVAGLK